MAEQLKNKMRLTAVVKGKVQGVFFRYFVQDVAKEMGLTGYAYNRAGGRSVEVVAEGAEADLEVLLSKLHVGPPDAIVEAVEASWSTAEGAFHGFRVG